MVSCLLVMGSYEFESFCPQALFSTRAKVAALSRFVPSVYFTRCFVNSTFQRIYVHESLYEKFVKDFVEVVKVHNPVFFQHIIADHIAERRTNSETPLNPLPTWGLL